MELIIIQGDGLKFMVTGSQSLQKGPAIMALLSYLKSSDGQIRGTERMDQIGRYRTYVQLLAIPVGSLASDMALLQEGSSF